MKNDLTERFRDADILRLRKWEQSRIGPPQLQVLHHIRRRPGVTTGHLARAHGITVSTTSGLAIKLVERGLIERGSTAADRRQGPLRDDDERDPTAPLAGGAR